MPGGYPSNYDPAPDPTEMLAWDEDIQPMLDACLNSRDRALVALAWDLGPRPGELFDLKPGAITDHDYGLQVTLDGKNGRRSPVLVPSVPYVRRWLDDHPGDADDPLWCKLTSPEGISNNRVRDALKDVADRLATTHGRPRDARHTHLDPTWNGPADRDPSPRARSTPRARRHALARPRGPATRHVISSKRGVGSGVLNTGRVCSTISPMSIAGEIIREGRGPFVIVARP